MLTLDKLVDFTIMKNCFKNALSTPKLCCVCLLAETLEKVIPNLATSSFLKKDDRKRLTECIVELMLAL